MVVASLLVVHAADNFMLEWQYSSDESHKVGYTLNKRHIGLFGTLAKINIKSCVLEGGVEL